MDKAPRARTALETKACICLMILISEEPHLSVVCNSYSWKRTSSSGNLTGQHGKQSRASFSCLNEIGLCSGMHNTNASLLVGECWLEEKLINSYLIQTWSDSWCGNKNNKRSKLCSSQDLQCLCLKKKKENWDLKGEITNATFRWVHRKLYNWKSPWFKFLARYY